jgi:hypothetical protein
VSGGDSLQRATSEPEGLKRYTLPAYTTISPDRVVAIAVGVNVPPSSL